MSAPIPAPRSSRSEEKRPLKLNGNVNNDYGSKWSPYGINFNIIIGSMAAVTVSITVAVIVQCFYGELQHFKLGAALITESKQCGEIGMEILKSGGSAVDAAIAMVLCTGVTMPHITSLGGGGVMMIRKGGHPVRNLSLNFLDFVSTSADEGWFHDQKEGEDGVPGVLKGLWLAHQELGHLEWGALVQPSIKLASEGFVVESSLAKELKNVWALEESIRQLFIIGDKLAEEGDVIKWPALAQTLNAIAEDEEAFYNGSLSDFIVANSTLSKQKLAEYSPTFKIPQAITYKGFSWLTRDSTIAFIFEILNYLEVSSQTQVNLANLMNVLEIELENSPQLRRQLSQGNISTESIIHLATLAAVNATSLKLPSPVATITSVADSRDLQVAIVSGLGVNFGSRYLKEVGIFMSDRRSWRQPQFDLKLDVLMGIKNKHKCQPSIIGLGNNYKTLFTQFHSWFFNDSSQSLTDDQSSVGLISRANNAFQLHLDSKNDAFTAII